MVQERLLRSSGFSLLKIGRDQITNMQAPRTYGLGELYPTRTNNLAERKCKPAPRIQNMFHGQWPVPIKCEIFVLEIYLPVVHSSHICCSGGLPQPLSPTLKKRLSKQYKAKPHFPSSWCFELMDVVSLFHQLPLFLSFLLPCHNHLSNLWIVENLPDYRKFSLLNSCYRLI